VHLRGRGAAPNLLGMAPKKKVAADKLRTWRVSILRSRDEYLGTVRLTARNLPVADFGANSVAA